MAKTKADKSLAELSPHRQPALPRQPGGWEGRISIGDDFDDPLPTEIQDAFEDSGPLSPFSAPSPLLD